MTHHIPRFKKVAVITKKDIKPKLGLVQKLVKYLESNGLEVYLDSNTSPLINGESGYKKTQLLDMVDLVVCLGGDGTILKTARRMSLKKVYVLPVNLGTLGFLTESTQENFFAHLDRIFKGQYVVDERMLLRITVYREHQKIDTFLALNEAAITQGSFARIISMDIEVNKRKIIMLEADGLIVSTPTGSTGHSLSAGGPIVHPKLGAFILTPVCPIALANRPIIIPADRQISIKVLSERKDESSRVGLTIDGQVEFPLLHGDEIKIRASSRKLRIIRMTGQNYYKMLRTKLSWGKN